jgi:hypothetical protein
LCPALPKARPRSHRNIQVRNQPFPRSSVAGNALADSGSVRSGAEDTSYAPILAWFRWWRRSLRAGGGS